MSVHLEEKNTNGKIKTSCWLFMISSDCYFFFRFSNSRNYYYWFIVKTPACRSPETELKYRFTFLYKVLKSTGENLYTRKIEKLKAKGKMCLTFVLWLLKGKAYLWLFEVSTGLVSRHVDKNLQKKKIF